VTRDNLQLFEQEIRMIRHICVAVLLVIASLHLALAQTEDDVAAARELYIAGDYAAALQVLIPAAEAGNARAQNIVGAAYQYGNGGLPVDAQKALQYFGLSAAQNFPSSHHNLGVLYENGMEGLDPDMQVARAYYEQSVAIGWVGSFEDLAHLLRDGIGGPADIPRAIDLLEQGRAQGDAESIHELAYMYHDGVAVPVNLLKARGLYAEAAATGIGQAQNDYGYMLEFGEGGPIDLQGAMVQYRAVMAAGEAYGAINAGWLIFNNPAVFPDQVEGLALCYWARDHATGEDATEYRASCDDVATGYSKADIDKALARAATLQLTD
jgi:uncharacterized protein